MVVIIFFGKKVIEIINNLLKKIPILRTIYSAIGQMTESLTKSDNKQKSVVLLEYPKKDVWAVGFATKENKGIINDKIGNDLVMFLCRQLQILLVVFYLWCQRKI